MSALFLALILIGTVNEPVVLVRAGSFLWKRRPEVRISAPAGDTAHRAIRLILTARDPQFFPTPDLVLTDGTGPDGTTVAFTRSDSSSVDARLSTNLHTLWFKLSPDEVRAWSAASAPTIRLGSLILPLDQVGRERLVEFAGRLPVPQGPR